MIQGMRLGGGASPLSAAVLLIALSAVAARGEGGAPWPQLSSGPLQDNSFLVEEAYNQEAGVIQHIFGFQRDNRSGDWAAAFTDEWPMPDERHQASVTVPFSIAGHTEDGQTGIGDIMLNYRYQLLFENEERPAVAPRLSLVLPTGHDRDGLGNGALGVETNFPVSKQVSDYFAVHLNLGGRVTPDAHAAGGSTNRATLPSWFAGGSLVLEPWNGLNLLTELLFLRSSEVSTTDDEATYQSQAYVNPGIRFGWNGPYGIQYVGGVALPVGITRDTASDFGLFFYLSIEHGITAAANAERDW